MRLSLYNSTRALATLAVATRTNGTVNGTTVDRHTLTSNYRAAMVIIHAGTITDGSHAITVQDSDNGSAWADVADEFLQGAEPTLDNTDSNTITEIGYLGHRRYLRAVAVTSGATTGGVFGAVVVVGQPRRIPVDRS